MAFPDRREKKNLLNHFKQLPGLAADHGAILFQLLSSLDHAVGDIFRRGTDHGQRRPQFVRNRRDEIHLQLGEPLRARAGDDQNRDADHQQEEHAKTDRQIAAARIRHERSQRSSPAMPHDQAPVLVISLSREAAETR